MRRPEHQLMQLAATAGVTLVAFWMLFHGMVSAMIAGMFLCILLAVFFTNRERGIYLAFFFLMFLGDIRRISGIFTGYGGYDLLVSVGPLFAVIAALPIFLRLRMEDARSKFAFAFVLIMILQVFNPGQGSITVGLSGLALVLPPILWFWIGREYGNEKMIRFVAHRIIVPVAVLACMLGFFQTFVGVPFWQQAWVQHQIDLHSTILSIGTGIRAFGFSTIVSEYNNLITLACYMCLIGGIAGRRVLFLPLIVLIPGLILGSSRGPVFHLLFAAAMGYAFKRRKNSVLPMPVRLAVAILVGFGGLSLVLSGTGDVALEAHGSAANAELAHQVNGLAHPLDKKYSTAGAHQGEIVLGFINAFKHPIGYGTGTTYFGSTSSDAGERIGSEFDVTDAFLNLGVPGGLVYVGFIITTILAGYRYTRFGPRDLSLPIFAMMIPQLGQWFFMGEYGNGSVFLFLLGSMVHLVNIEEKASAKRARLERVLLRGRASNVGASRPAIMPESAA